MTKIAYNRCHGGFSLSEAGMRRYADVSGMRLDTSIDEYGFTHYKLDGHNITCRDFDRSNRYLIEVIESLGAAANGRCADLAIAEIPSGTKYRIDEYDGAESVMTIDDYEWSIA